MLSTQCNDDFMKDVNRFNSVVFASVGWTVLNWEVAFALIARGVAPRILAYYHGTTGTIKIILAFWIYLLIPVCPSGCACLGEHMSPSFLAFLPLLIGLLWLRLAYHYYLLAKAADGRKNEKQSSKERTEITAGSDNSIMINHDQYPIEDVRRFA